MGTFADLAASKTLSIELAEDGCSVEETPLVHGGLIDVAGGEVGDHTSMLGTVERVLARAGLYVVWRADSFGLFSLEWPGAGDEEALREGLSRLTSAVVVAVVGDEEREEEDEEKGEDSDLVIVVDSSLVMDRNLRNGPLPFSLRFGSETSCVCSKDERDA